MQTLTYNKCYFELYINYHQIVIVFSELVVVQLFHKLDKFNCVARFERCTFESTYSVHVFSGEEVYGNFSSEHFA